MKPWAEKFYKSASWGACRSAFLSSKNYCCERCGDVAVIVHHKTYLTPANISDAYVSLGWDNLEALCQTCHNMEHHGSHSNTNASTRYMFDADGQPILK